MDIPGSYLHQNAAHNFAAAGFGESIRKLDFVRYGNRADGIPHVVGQFFFNASDSLIPALSVTKA